MIFGKKLDSPTQTKSLEGSQVNVMIDVELLNEILRNEGRRSVYKSVVVGLARCLSQLIQCCKLN